MTWAMYDALADACEQVDADQRIRVFVLRGAGDAFAAGTDIRQFTEFASADDGIAYERRMDGSSIGSSAWPFQPSRRCTAWRPAAAA